MRLDRKKSADIPPRECEEGTLSKRVICKHMISTNKQHGIDQ